MCLLGKLNTYPLCEASGFNVVSFAVGSFKFVVVNKLPHCLTETGSSSPAIKKKIIYANGSIPKISEIPEERRAIY